MDSLKRNGFTLGLIVVVLAAYFFPKPGLESGIFYPEWTTQLGVFVVFLLQGLALSTRELTVGCFPLRLHGFVLVWNYLLFPLVAVAFIALSGDWLSPDLSLGFGLLSILPTTIASAIAFTALARGQVANALFSTVLSNLLAVFIVPIWVSVYLAADASISLPIGALVLKLSVLILLPIFGGQCIRRLIPFSGVWAGAHGKKVTSGIILFIVYAAVASSVASGSFKGWSVANLVLFISLVAVFLILISALVWLSSRLAAFSQSQRIAAFYCASQKSLATGLPLAAAVLSVLPDAYAVEVGALLLPLIVYHPLQLVFAAVLLRFK